MRDSELARPGPTQQPAELQFVDEPGSSRSKWVAGLLAVGLIVWMGSGFLLPAPDDEVPATGATVAPVSVKVLDSQAQSVTKTFSAEGQAQPDRRAILRPQTSGEVVELLAAKGATVADGQEIVRLSTRELEARLAEAREAVTQSRQDFENTQSLFDRGVATATRLRETRAALASDVAQLAQAEEALNAAVISAPFAGRLDRLDLEIGAYVSTGTDIGTVLDTDPLRIVIQVPQQSLAQIHEGTEAQVTFITGEERTGTIDYVSRDAETDTRTFRAEITVPNADGRIASGLSVQVRIPTEEVTAHFISPAILSLDADGQLGVKTVEDNDKVAFYQVVVERAQRDGVWVSGLPDTARIITIGQGFVSAGETVAPVPDDSAPEDIGTAGPDAEIGG